ncbi:MAG TPA: DUF5990 family protein [Pyrinomonadaceae bacterium]|jgi:hypothetical protein
MEKHEIRLRINVLDPLAGVTMQVQEGKDRLLAPTETKRGRISFEFPVTVDLSSGKPNFLGKFAQGPKDARFIYVNSGSYAAQAGTGWNRRAKISLMKITAAQVKEVLNAPGARLEVTIDGVGRDGGPMCASVRSAEDGWRIMKS